MSTSLFALFPQDGIDAHTGCMVPGCREPLGLWRYQVTPVDSNTPPFQVVLCSLHGLAAEMADRAPDEPWRCKRLGRA